MPRYSGKYGAVDGQTTVSNWVANVTNTPTAFRASNTRAGTDRRRGVRDWTGSFTQMTPIPTLMPGDIFTFTGYMAPTSGIWGTVGPTKTGQAIVESIVITWAWETNEPINCVTNIAGVSPLTNDTGTITDVTIPDTQIPEGLWIKYGNPGDDPATVFAGANKLENTVRATLTLTCTNNRFVDSDTAGWASRQRGTFDWTMEVVQNDVHISSTPYAIDDIMTLVLPVNATDYWAFQWGRLLNFSGVNVDINTGNILQQTISFGMQATDPTLAAVGEIYRPGEVTAWWPWVD